jgi:hypothetical protein
MNSHKAELFQTHISAPACRKLKAGAPRRHRDVVEEFLRYRWRWPNFRESLIVRELHLISM